MMVMKWENTLKEMTAAPGKPKAATKGKNRNSSII
jgi:hypothetical protein